jgi:hypothetical protein
MPCHPSGRGPRKPASPDQEPNFYLMPVIPVTVIKPPPVRSMSPTKFAASTKKLQDGRGSEAVKQQQQACNGGVPAATPLRSASSNGGWMTGSKAPEVEDAFRQGCSLGFSAAASLAVGLSIAPNQGEQAKQEVQQTTMITTTVQRMTSSPNRIQDDSQVVCREEIPNWHIAAPGTVDGEFDRSTFEW